MPAIRVAVHIQPAHADMADIRAAVVRAEEMGVDAIYTWDHFVPFLGDPTGRSFECWTLLASWAEVTESVELGTLVNAVGYRNPDLLADMARTVDHLSGGRMVLGLGAGTAEADYREYGIPFGSAGERLDDLEAAVPRIRARFTRLNPGPVGHLPIMVGGGGEQRTLKIAARFADRWHGYGPPPVIARKTQVLDAHCASVGRDPLDIERSCGAQADAVASGDALLEAGASTITIGFHGGTGFDLAPVADWLSWRDQHNGD